MIQVLKEEKSLFFPHIFTSQQLVMGKENQHFKHGEEEKKKLLPKEKLEWNLEPLELG